MSSPRRPPTCVVLVARTHGLVGATAFASLFILHLLTRRLPHFEFGTRTYAIATGIGLTYCLTGALVWWGTPGGRFMSRVCGLLYLARPQLGSHLWRIMDSAEYRAYFLPAGRGPTPPHAAPGP